MAAERLTPLKRILGAPTALCIGMGVAIGSGIFRTPGLVAEQLQVPWLIILAWVFGGVFVLMAGMVTAELATRFPQAGGEYVFLREAYGEFVAFFFGWAYTIFIVGGGAASIAAAFGDFGCTLFVVNPAWSGVLAAAAIVAVTGVNALGLRTGAWTQNVFTAVKIAALLVIVIIGLTHSIAPVKSGTARDPAHGMQSVGLGWSWLAVFSAGVVPVLWAYDGTTDSVKMAEEIKDVRRALPRALIGSAVALTVIYVLVNVALMRLMPVGEMAGVKFVPGKAMSRVFGPAGENAMLAVAMVICLGALSSTVLATIRVTFALARDGLTFRFMAYMSASQAPVHALWVVATFAVILVLTRTFSEVLQIYFFASAILFGLSYASLIVFRLREREFPTHAFRCPAGIVQAVALILIMFALAAGIAIKYPKDAAYTTGLLIALGTLYFFWKKPQR
ncbi:MAG: amino acid permease [Phycisphaerae bacterium]